MDVPNWADAITAVAGVGGLVFVGTQVNLARQASNISIGQNFLATSRELWDCCMTAAALTEEEDPSRNRFRFCVGQILGHFDYFAITIIDGSIKGKTSDFIEETICDYLDDMAANNYAEIVKAMTTKRHVCKNLKDFCKQREFRFVHKEIVINMLNS